MFRLMSLWRHPLGTEETSMMWNSYSFFPLTIKASPVALHFIQIIIHTKELVHTIACVHVYVSVNTHIHISECIYPPSVPVTLCAVLVKLLLRSNHLSGEGSACREVIHYCIASCWEVLILKQAGNLQPSPYKNEQMWFRRFCFSFVLFCAV